jgi:hypothetical protein
MRSYMLAAEYSLPAWELKLRELDMEPLDLKRLLVHLTERKRCYPDLTQAST